MNLDKDYWENRYVEGTTGWDTGYITRPIKEYIDQLEAKSLSILTPGSGPSHEAEYIHQQGFENIHIIDMSELAMDTFKKRYPTFPESQIHVQDLLEHTGKYDIIIEQTCFCALEPHLRNQYLNHIKSMLNLNGKYVGLLFQHMELSDTDGPPFGGDLSYYLELFGNHFEIKTMEDCYDSIDPRAGNELWFSVG